MKTWESVVCVLIVVTLLVVAYLSYQGYTWLNMYPNQAMIFASRGVLKYPGIGISILLGERSFTERHIK